MTADVVWPTAVLPARSGRPQIVSATVGGGRAMSGLEQAVASDAGYFAMKMVVPVSKNAQVKAWNALEAILGGRSGTALIPALDCKRAPWPIVGGVALTDFGDIPFSDDALEALFDDDAGFSDPVIVAALESSILAGGLVATIRMSAGADLEAGMHFSAKERLFRIARIVSSSADGDDKLWSVRLALPAREPLAAGTILDFSCPMFRAVLASDGEMALDLDLMKFGTATINWVEDI